MMFTCFLKVYIISELKFKAVYRHIIIICFMITASEILPQSSYDPAGGMMNTGSGVFRYNSFESNPGNYTVNGDWEFSLLLGYENISENYSNVYFFSGAKRIGRNYFYARYSPGLKKKFSYSTGSTITLIDTLKVETSLTTGIEYSELFGFGYSFNLAENFSSGFSLRHLRQEINRDIVQPVISDTANYISTVTDSYHNNIWKTDIGLYYRVNEQIGVGFSTNNLALFSEADDPGTEDDLWLRNIKQARFRFDYTPLSNLDFRIIYESGGKVVAGGSYTMGKLTFNFNLLHDQAINPFPAAFSPGIYYSTGFLSLYITGIKYLPPATGPFNLEQYLNEGIDNLHNNRYSGDKLFFGANLSLSFIPKKKVEFIDVNIEKDIYPTLYDIYQNIPFATARVRNISGKSVSVKPSSIIEGINKERVYSPSVTIEPGDSAIIKFYTLVEEDYREKGRKISNARFFLSSLAENDDDIIKLPLLINDMNSWDGNVENLRYFVKYQFPETREIARKVLEADQTISGDIPPALNIFHQVKILHRFFISGKKYVSDPRAAVEKVQFPIETLELGGGDCDDLSVAFSALLESVGIQTAFVDYKPEGEGDVGHVNLLINTKLTPENISLITKNDKKYIIRGNVAGREEAWAPLELTVSGSFDDAWNDAAERFYREAISNLGLSKGTVRIVDVY